VAAVLAGYMGGLAVGSAVAARVAPRLTRPVLVYGVLELGIALSALAIPFGMRGLTLAYVAAFGGGEPSAPGAVASAFRLGGAFSLLLLPTALMGATLPLLARHAIRRNEEIGPRIGALYGINTTGAIAGTLCAAFLLLPLVGLRQTVVLGALVNGLVFVAAAALARDAAPPVAEPSEASATDGAADWILPMMLLSGAVSFAYEVLWTRLLSQLLGGSIYAFATMLSSFLAGIALGSALGGWVARRAERAGTGFALSQLGIALLAVAAFAAADSLPALASSLGAGWRASPVANAPLAAAVLLPVALCIGATFPLAVRMLAPDPAGTPRATARVYAWNTVGAIVGSIGAAFLLLPGLGFAGTVRVGAATSLVIAAVTSLLAKPRQRGPLLGAAALAVALALSPIGNPWRLLRASPLTLTDAVSEVRFLAVGRSSTVLLLERPGSFSILTNGLPESTIPKPEGIPGRGLEQRWLGLLPLLLRPDAEHLLVIGLGGGMAVEGVPPSVGAVDVVELEEQVIVANREIGPERAIDPLAERRTRIVVDDARGALLLSDRRYDAIVSQPSHPWTAGASHLYTEQFFELARERLADDGVFVQWIGLRFVDETLLTSLLATLTAVFPHVEVYNPVPAALLFAASKAPLDIAAGRQALRESADHFARYGLRSIEDAAAALTLDAEGAPAVAAGAEINRDDRNLLASRSSRLRGETMHAASLRRISAAHDPLPALTKRLDGVRLARALLRQSRPERARAVSDALAPAARETALGWAAFQRGEETAAEHFRRALDMDPESLEAHAGAMLSAGDQGSVAGAPEAVSKLERAMALDARGDDEALEAMDDALGGLDPGGPLFEPALWLRASWRLRSRDPTRGLEALALLDTQVARNDRPSLQLRRARAAHIAGREGTAWIALDDLSRRLRRADRPRVLARRALALSRLLDDGHALSAGVRVRLARAAR
jgi:spermidine synthase